MMRLSPFSSEADAFSCSRSRLLSRKGPGAIFVGEYFFSDNFNKTVELFSVARGAVVVVFSHRWRHHHAGLSLRNMVAAGPAFTCTLTVHTFLMTASL